MIPVPNYIKQYATDHKQKGNRLSFHVQCSCGCNRFALLEKSYTNDEKRLIKEYEDSLPNTGWHSVYGGVDSSGKPYHYIKILGIFKKHIVFPDAPVFMDIHVLKAMCSQCRKEIVLFDSRHHGYDGMRADDAEAAKYHPHFKPRDGKLYEIEVTVENDPSLDAFNEAMGEQCSSDVYSNSFCWIGIKGTDENGRKKVLFDFESA